jgi:hypothetical protein
MVSGTYTQITIAKLDGRSKNLGRQTRKPGGISTGRQPCEQESKFLHGKLI